VWGCEDCELLLDCDAEELLLLDGVVSSSPIFLDFFPLLEEMTSPFSVDIWSVMA